MSQPTQLPDIEEVDPNRTAAPLWAIRTRQGIVFLCYDQTYFTIKAQDLTPEVIRRAIRIEEETRSR